MASLSSQSVASLLVVCAMYPSISSSSPLNKPVTIELEHCAYIVKERQKKLRFVVAKSQPFFKFRFLHGGLFSSKSCIGKISLQTFSVLLIVNINDSFMANDIVGVIVGSRWCEWCGFPTVGAFIGGTIAFKVVRKLIN